MNVGVWVCATVCIPTEAREEDNPLLLSTSLFETGSLTEQKAGPFSSAAKPGSL